MPTVNQLVRKGRSKKKRRKRLVTRALEGAPQMSGTVLWTRVETPRKPNSAKRKVGRVKLRNGVEVSVFIPGEGHNVKEHDQVLVQPGRTPDLVGYKYKIVRGAHGVQGVPDRKQGRSRYGTKK